MTTGKTGEKILISGKYFCNLHTNHEVDLLIDGIFPRCIIENGHESIWTLKEQNQVKNDLTSTTSTENIVSNNPDSSVFEENVKVPKKETVFIYNGKAEPVYKRKGFYAAINHKKFPDNEIYKLESLIIAEQNIDKERIESEKAVLAEQVRLAVDKFDYLRQQIDQKQTIKDEFKKELDKMKVEFTSIQDEIISKQAELYNEIKKIGLNKESLISNRIKDFKTEIDKIIDTYQEIEKKQNDRFKLDFISRGGGELDKTYYTEIITELKTNFKAVQNRLSSLEQDGLNISVARFLIFTGWLSAIAASWFFDLWKTNPSNNLNNKNIITYILNGLRSFALQNEWYVTLAVFLGYIIVIMIIAWLCYKSLLRNSFIKRKLKNKNVDDPDNNIELDLDKKHLLKASFKANSWFEMWLKITPIVATLILLIAIIAWADKGNHILQNDFEIYSKMGNSHFIHLIGFLIPIAFSSIFMLYIINVIEKRKNENSQSEFAKKNSLFSFNWEISILAILFIGLIVLFYINSKNISWISDRQIGAIGFLISCACTGFALAYGYRYISLNESFITLFDEIRVIDKYIERNFNPFQTSYLEHGSIHYRMRTLYHSLLNLLESKNELSAILLNPYYKKELIEEKRKKKMQVESDIINKEKESAVSKDSKESQTNIWERFVKSINDTINSLKSLYESKLKGKQKEIDNLKDEIDEMKKDNVDLEELTYFPETGAKIKQIKSYIEQLMKRASSLKEEMDGYFRNEKTYASINAQINNLNDDKNKLNQELVELNKGVIQTQIKLKEEFDLKAGWITEGYTIGLWYGNKFNEML